MITDERKSELLSLVEYDVNRFIDKQDIFSMAVDYNANTAEEHEFLHSCNSYFTVEE